jgi:chlorobactene glucosyltransferase
MSWLVILAFGILVTIVVVAALNAVTFPRLEPASPPRQPLVSILIPARDEAARIRLTLEAHVRTNYPACEILVLDDQSTDDTAQQVAIVAAQDPRIQLLAAEALPRGWVGKTWACDQLARQAHGEVLVFTDADVEWLPDALPAVLSLLDALPVDLLTVWPTQRTETWAERLVVPLMLFAICAYLPELAVRKARFASLAAANGQCLVFRRAAYERIGGHAAVRGEIIEDVALARRIKRQGLRLGMALGGGKIACRMYQGWSEVLHGYAKNIVAGHGGRPALLVVSSVIHLGLFVAPWLWLGAAAVAGAWPTFWQPALLVGLGLGARALTAATTGEPVRRAVWMPVAVLLMTAIAGKALWWQLRFGGPEWKGRRISTKRDGGR